MTVTGTPIMDERKLAGSFESAEELWFSMLTEDGDSELVSPAACFLPRLNNYEGRKASWGGSDGEIESGANFTRCRLPH